MLEFGTINIFQKKSHYFCLCMVQIRAMVNCNSSKYSCFQYFWLTISFNSSTPWQNSPTNDLNLKKENQKQHKQLGFRSQCREVFFFLLFMDSKFSSKQFPVMQTSQINNIAFCKIFNDIVSEMQKKAQCTNSPWSDESL